MKTTDNCITVGDPRETNDFVAQPSQSASTVALGTRQDPSYRPCVELVFYKDLLRCFDKLVRTECSILSDCFTKLIMIARVYFLTNSL